MPKLQIVRFTPINLAGFDQDVRNRFWDDLLARTEAGGVIVLNFQQIVILSSVFLGSLFYAHKKCVSLGIKFVGCHLSDDLQSIFYIASPKQPLDWMLNYVDSEEQAIAKARKLLGILDERSEMPTD